MFKKILVALDNSTHRPAVFKKALDLASATGAELMLCHVLSAYEEGSPGIPIRSYQAYYPVLEDTTGHCPTAPRARNGPQRRGQRRIYPGRGRTRRHDLQRCQLVAGRFNYGG